MKFTVDGAVHEFDEDRITFAEGRALEKVTGYSFATLMDHGGELTVIQAFIWVALKREEPTLAFSALDDRAIGDFEFDQGGDDDDDTPTGGGDGTETDAPSTPSV